MEQSIPKFTSKGSFTDDMKRAVNDYFERNKIKKTGDWRLYLKTLVFFGAFIVFYYLLVFTHSPPIWLWLPSVFLLGYYVLPGIGFCVMHDAIHGSYSQYDLVNKIAGFSLNFLGANNTLWYTKHNVIHHTNTNINHFDADIEAKPVFRFDDNQPWTPIHRHQHLYPYWIFFYSLLYPLWVWVNDYQRYFSKKVLYKQITFSLPQHISFWVSKVVYVTIFAVVPIYQVGFLPWLLGYAIITLVCSVRISLVFQLAHVVTGLAHPTRDEAHGDEWFRHQVSTTADFAPQSKTARWFLGGLNYQIEHHLFPKVSHVHYPDIHEIVKSVCERWNVPMLVFPTTKQAIQAHIAELKRLGRRP